MVGRAHATMNTAVAALDSAPHEDRIDTSAGIE